MSKQYKYKSSFTVDGRRYYVCADTQKELAAKMALKKRDIEEGRVVITGSMTVKEWVRICLDTYKCGIRPDTLQNMKYRINKHVVSAIGNYQIKTIKPIQCQAIINAQAGMSYSHVRSLMQELSFIFEKAVENQLILSNPAANLTRPNVTKGKRRSITAFERKHLLAVADADPSYNLFLLMLYCGCRPAEAMKCIGKDIQVVDGYRCLHIRGTKTDNSDRIVPLPDDMYNRLDLRSPLDPLCPNRRGRCHSESSYDRLVAHLKRDMNISMGCRVYRNQLVPPLPLADDFVPYDLRHTYCTDLQRKGVDIRTAQRLMGHGDIKITANIYTHVDNDLILSSASLLGASNLHDIMVSNW